MIAAITSSIITFNSTRYISNKVKKRGSGETHGNTFNSTRYIMNCQRVFLPRAQTPAFNSTRYIRNELLRPVLEDFVVFAFNSTRYIRNALPLKIDHKGAKLSTPHGTLGTSAFPLRPSRAGAFQLHTVH